MPSWNELLLEINENNTEKRYDIVRRKYLKKLFEKTGRNVIAYYSGWLNKKIPNIDFGINDNDKNGFMNAVKNLDRTKGLDLLLHTPGGDLSATESLIDYLRKIFGTNIRAIIPQIAMSGGTMIACSANTIIMGKQSSLGPIDPQLKGGIPAHGIIEEFKKAHDEILEDKTKIALWQPIIAKYNPTLIGECQKSIDWANEIATDILSTGMFKDLDPKERTSKINCIVKELGDHALTKSHARHLSADRCMELGLNIQMMEDDDELQDLILSVHHSMIITLTATNTFKIIENHDEKAFVQHVNIIAR